MRINQCLFGRVPGMSANDGVKVSNSEASSSVPHEQNEQNGRKVFINLYFENGYITEYLN